MKQLFLFTFSISFLLSCTSKKNDHAVNVEDSIVKASFFPVSSFLKGQMLVLDSLPVTIMYLNSSKGKTDTIWLKKEQVRPLLKDFISNEIAETNLTVFFKESKFNDQSIGAITYSYDPRSTLPDSIAIRHWNIYVNPQKGTVTKVFMLKLVKENGNYYSQQLTWQTDNWAKITTILNKADGNSEVLKEEKLVWGFNEQ